MTDRECESCTAAELAAARSENHALRACLERMGRGDLVEEARASAAASKSGPQAEDASPETLRICAALANYRALALEHQAIRQALRVVAEQYFAPCATCERFATGFSRAHLLACDAHGSGGEFPQALLVRILEEG